MLHAIAIISQAEIERNNKAKELASSFFKGESLVNNPDFKTIEDEKSLKIEDVRRLQKFLSFKPYKFSRTVTWLKNAHRLTLPAQHSLLKTLEEPPAHSILILTSESESSLLPTILSRCQIVSLDSKLKIEPESHQITQDILSSTPGVRLIMADRLAASRHQAIDFCRQQIVYWQSQLLTQKKPQITNILREIHNAQIMLHHNVNPGLVIGNLLLSYPH